MRASIPLVLATFSGAAMAQIQMLPAVNYTTPATPDGMASADFDGDSRPDLAVAALSPDRILVLRNNGNGTFAAPQAIALPAGSAPNFVRAVDIDLDGDWDMVVVLRDAKKLQILRNNGSGTFTLGPSVNTGNNPRWLITRPLRPGSVVDMAVLNRADGTMTVYLNNGSLQFTPTTYPVGADPRCIAAADITGDTRPDLCISSYAEGKITIYNNNGNGTFAITGGLPLEPGRKPNGLIAADFSGDGIADLAVASAGTNGGQGVIATYRRLSTFGYVGPTDYPSGGLNPGQVAAADMDHDGKNDLVVVNPDSQNIGILRWTGSMVFAAPVVVAVGAAPRVMSIADFDNDAIFDIAVTNLNSGTTSVLINAQGGPAPCYANCDSSTVAPVLNANDFQCFLNRFAAGSTAANCDNSTAAPTLNANDFQCFLNKFATGCT